MSNTLVQDRMYENQCGICKKDLSSGKVPTTIQEHNGHKVFICATHPTPVNKDWRPYVSKKSK